MRSLLTEVERIRQMIGQPLNEMAKPSEQYIKSIQTILSANGLLKKEAESLLNQIIELADDQIINFDLLEHGVRNTLLKKGDKYKAIVKYFEKVLGSLKDREPDSYEIEPEQDDYSFEPEEPSILKKKVFRKELYYLQVELLKLQEWLMETGKTVIIVFEGRDSAGKGSTIKKFTENLNPRYYKVIALGIPTPDERKNWWDRYRNQIEKGKINLFDRSWYNRGLIEPVAGYGTPEEYKDFMNNVATFENDLVKDGDYLFKLWFSIDKETQAKRFKARQESPLKKWKYSESDAKMQDLWDKFTRYKDKLFDETSTLNNPWVVLDAIDKRVSGLNAIRYVLKNIPYDDKNEAFLDVEYPEALTVLKPEQN